jgi:cell division septum initiation protein DivIVA
MSAEAGGLPEFTTAMRGYDRLQVDEYVASLLALVAELEERARAAESQLGMGAPATIGPRVTQIFDLALAEAAELRERVQAEADALLADADRRRDEIVAGAERDAESIRVQVHAQREEARAELEREHELASAQVVALERRKGKLVDELRRLQVALGSAADSVADGATEAPAWNEAGETKTIELPTELPGADPDPFAPDR